MGGCSTNRERIQAKDIYSDRKSIIHVPFYAEKMFIRQVNNFFYAYRDISKIISMNNIIKLSLQHILFFVRCEILFDVITLHNEVLRMFIFPQRTWDIFVAAETPARLCDHTEYLSSFSSIENFFEVCLCRILIRGDLK